ncbi:MAG: EAL domain-containing protein [Acetobacteraceae bacterium]|nr:EAL domain-containing protein [Acetobacteraceae bacterium]
MQDLPSAASAACHAPARFRLQPDRRAEAARRRRLLRDLDVAITQDAPSLLLRPRVSLSDGHPVAEEASWRWSHRRHGTLPGTALADMAGKSALGERLALWFLRRLCHLAARRTTCIPISLRVPRALLPLPVLEHHLLAALMDSRAIPALLELRFAEDQLNDLSPEDVLVLSRLRDMGVGIALEQFGSGPTSLGLLRRLPLSAVILAADLLRHLPQDDDDRAMLHAIIAAAHGLGLATVACGVERQAQMNLLRTLGCGAAQGPGIAFGLAA